MRGQALKRAGIVAGLLACVGLGTYGIAEAATGGSSAVISACVGKSGGVRILKSGQKCTSAETPLQWNQTGPVGATGPQGARGPLGPRGLRGATGPAGAGALVTFSFGTASLSQGNVFYRVSSKPLAAGLYSVTATANLTQGGKFAGGDSVTDTVCQLRDQNNGVMGSATDRRAVPNQDKVKISLSMNGGYAAPAQGGSVNLWCLSQGGAENVDQSQVMITKIAGFF